MSALAVENLVYTYPATRSSPCARQALKGISFRVSEGEMFGLLGPNGGGKSTAFHILSTYFPPAGGEVSIFGYDLEEQTAAVRRSLGVVFQSPGLDPKLTVTENLIHQGHLYGLTGTPLRQRIREVLARVGLSDRSHDRVEILSGGLKRRAEIAKGLLHQPRLLLLDEPSTGLDPGARRDLWRYLRELQQQERITILFTTHLMEEADSCDRVAILHEGRLVALGTPQALKQEIGGDIVSLEASDPVRLKELIEQKYRIPVRMLGSTLRLERDRGHEFIPALVGDFPGQVRSVTLGKPTLEDVFILKTGHRLWEDHSESAS